MSTTVDKKVPFVDLQAQYATIKSDIDAAIAKVISNTAFILGPEAAAFEDEFAAYTGFKHCVAVGNGTDALRAALEASGIERGDQVIAPSHTFMATPEAITHSGGSVRLADVSEETFNMTAETLEAALTPDTKFVVPVPIYGNPAGMDEVVDLCRKRSLRVVMDAAQAHGAAVGGRKLGELVDTASYSFYPGKNLGAYGDAGAICTHDDEVARLARLWRNHGGDKKTSHQFEGTNSRMDGIQAAILRVKLPHLEGWTEARRNVARMYGDALQGIADLRLPAETEGARHVYHLYVVRVPDRDQLRKDLAERGVGSGVHYPLPIHLQPAYARLGHDETSFPAATAICRHIVSLPMYPEMGQAEVDHVAAALRDLLG